MKFPGSGRVHFVGIGGAGMSAIAKVLIEKEVRVSGSDLKRSRATITLEALGAEISIGHRASLVDGAEVVVVSSAIPKNNPEYKRAGESGIATMSRGEALAALIEGHDAIVVAGTHGKTTTTSMIVSVLSTVGLDPTFLVGGGLNDVGTNARLGKDRFAVAESDESDGSFLLLRPYIAVVTNVEADHLDHWGSVDAVQRAFVSFLQRVRTEGAAVLPAGNGWLSPVPGPSRRVTFGSGGAVHATSVTLLPRGARFTLHCPKGSAEVTLRVPGLHNVSNALAAAAACLEAGVPVDEVARGLGTFRGVDRRFQVRGQAGGVTVIDDYAHHPTEVKATLATARRGDFERVIAVFQPHLYSRTRALCADFGESFSDADRIVVTDVYGAREEPVPGVTGKLIADEVCRRLPGRPVAYLPHRSELVSYLLATARPGDALLTLGAGDVNAVGEEVLGRLETERDRLGKPGHSNNGGRRGRAP
jgi:UDP-N-acetylmuramate--alanine ligase